MKTITLLPHESRAAAQGTLRAVWRPVEPQPYGHRWTYTGPINGAWWLHEETEDPLDGESVTCPYGQRGDVVVGKWSEQKKVLHVSRERRFRITSVDVRRVSEMKEADAAAWGLGCSARALAWMVWTAHYGQAEWAWVMGLTATTEKARRPMGDTERGEGVVRQDAQMWSLVARMHAAVATMEGMKAHNVSRAEQGCAQAYGEESFFEQSNILEALAMELKTKI